MNEDPRAPFPTREKVLELGISVLAIGLGAWMAVLALIH